MKRFLARHIAMLVAALAIVIPISVVGLSAAPASASGGSCNLASQGFVCIEVNGTGLHVTHINIGYTGFHALGELCFYSATFWVTDQSGNLVDAGVQFHNGCSFGGFYFDWNNLNVNYPNHSTICGYFYTDNYSTELGVACVGVHS